MMCYEHMMLRVALLFTLFIPQCSSAQDVDALMKKLRLKMDVVNDYRATGRLKTDVSFLRVPVSRIQVLYRKPDKFRIKKDGGISLLPKGGISVNLNALLATGNVTAIDAGSAVLKGLAMRMIKVLPADEKSDIILSTLYIDEQKLLIRKAVTTTRENGTYEMEMDYGKYAGYGLPDRVVVTFNTKDYKLPKGITFEYDPGQKPADPKAKPADRKGRVEITYEAYTINPGLKDADFK
jgi:outer membrane lipoprotein-sorting protein